MRCRTHSSNTRKIDSGMGSDPEADAVILKRTGRAVAPVASYCTLPPLGLNGGIAAGGFWGADC